jgi:hypothetical protein
MQCRCANAGSFGPPAIPGQRRIVPRCAAPVRTSFERFINWARLATSLQFGGDDGAPGMTEMSRLHSSIACTRRPPKPALRQTWKRRLFGRKPNVYAGHEFSALIEIRHFSPKCRKSGRAIFAPPP